MNNNNKIFDSSRQALLESWLRLTLADSDFTLTHLAADAGARRYLRIKLPDQTTLVLMDAPGPQNNIRQFVSIAKILSSHELNVPAIVNTNYQDGLLLLSDLGDNTFLKSLNNENADKLFDDATSALVKAQSIVSATSSLANYSDEIMAEELALFETWYLREHLKINLEEKARTHLNNALKLILDRCVNQPAVFTHRDYMPRNLMVCGDNPGILDFQDALMGPISYDVVSLFKDAFISWEEEQILDWTIRYWEKARQNSLPVPTDFGQFYEDCEWMGLQRHLKVLGIFSRLKHRDGKQHYIEDAPRFLNYIRKVASRYDALKPLLVILDQIENTEHDVRHTF
ncbi:phosphotransferase [Burkholderiales bacterium]|nr:phosphotransferase [Betaproteobacteria bacterium]MDA9295507.1 phosphotransferase [Burkholderiales bacterium]MDC3408252.1 phosphotransferase [Burkholderiales bacterium]